MNMHGQQSLSSSGREGLSLVELLVVMAILAILGGLTVPALLTFLPADDLEGDTRELFTRLKFAQVHAISQHVDTAVVYALDNYLSPQFDPENDDPLREPVNDSITGGAYRVATAYAVVERIKDEDLANFIRSVASPLPGDADNAELYAPLDSEEGNFTEFDFTVSLLLEDLVTRASLYKSARPRYVTYTENEADPEAIYVNQLDTLGMSNVFVVLGYEEAEDAFEGELPPGSVTGVSIVPFPGHIFKQTGGMYVPYNAPERFTIHVAPKPNIDPEQRVENASVVTSPLVVRGIDLYRSTGRVRIVER